MKECPKTQSGKHRPVLKSELTTPWEHIVSEEIAICAYCGLILDNYEKNTAGHS